MADAIAFAARSGLSEVLETTLNAIEVILAQTPRTWGDPERNYPGMQATQFVRHMVSDGLRVIYPVHNSEPVVIVRSISPIRGGPFRPNSA
jgi:hypothetical protein